MYSYPMEDRSEIPPGTLYMLVLKTLARLGEMHGYGIAQHVHRISDDVLQVEEGSLYPALQRMLIKGWVVAEWKQSENNRRARFYRLTPAGRKQLAAEIAEFENVMGAITRVIQPAVWNPYAGSSITCAAVSSKTSWTKRCAIISRSPRGRRSNSEMS